MDVVVKPDTLKKTLLGGVSLLALTAMLGVGGVAHAGAITVPAGTSTIITADTVASNTVAGSTTSHLSFNPAAGNNALSVTFSGAGTTNIGNVTQANASNHSSDTWDIIIGNGAASTVVIINGAITGDDAGNTTLNDLDITIDASAGGAGNSSLSIYGNVDASTGVGMSGDADGLASLTIGDGVSAAVFSGTIIAGNGSAANNSTINIAAGSTIAGAIDLSDDSTAAQVIIINMAAGTTISGAITDTADADLFTLNVNGSATISALVDAGHTTAANIEIDDTFTLTVSGTGLISVDSIDIAGTTGVLKVTGAKTITGAIDAGGGTGEQGTLDIDANTTIATALGGNNKLLKIDIADGITLTANNSVTATTLNLGSATAGGTFATGGGLTITALVEGSATGKGTLDINHTTTIASTATVGATTSIAAINIAAVTATISADIKATTILFDGDGTANFAADKTQTGTITTGTDGEGTLAFLTATADKTLVSGNVGVAASAALLATTVNTGNGITSTFGGQVNSDTITVASTGTVAFTGAVTAATKVDVAGAATLTFAEDLTVGNLDFSADGTATFAANKKIVGAVFTNSDGEGTLTQFRAEITDHFIPP